MLSRSAPPNSRILVSHHLLHRQPHLHLRLPIRGHLQAQAHQSMQARHPGEQGQLKNAVALFNLTTSLVGFFYNKKHFKLYLKCFLIEFFGGDYLLSRSSHYHRPWCISLLCSKWEQVGQHQYNRHHRTQCPVGSGARRRRD